MMTSELTKPAHRTAWTIAAVVAGMASAVCFCFGAIWLADGLGSPEANDLSLALGQVAVGAGIVGLIIAVGAVVLARSHHAANRRLAVRVITVLSLVCVLLVVLATTGVL